MNTQYSNKKPLNIDDAALEWAIAKINSLSIRERVGQCLMSEIRIENVESAKAQIKSLIEDNSVGSFYFYKSTCNQHVELHKYADKISKIPIMMAIDAEWGLPMRLFDTPRFPVNMSIGAIQDISLIKEYGDQMSNQCRRMGIHVNFSPVLDINSNPNNPVIAARSYGESREIVATRGIAYAQALENGGVLSVAKHFPGHGDTSEDSHKTLPTVNRNLIELENNELYPFKKYIDAGLGGIMTAHLDIPALDSTTGLCTSLSPIVVTGLLKEKMGFSGLIFTDALMMDGVAKYQDTIIKALLAGNHVILAHKDVTRQVDTIIEMIESGEISQSIVDDACLKVLEYKYALGASLPCDVDMENLNEDLSIAQDIISRLFCASITLVSDKKNLLPVSIEKRILLISLGENENLVYTALGEKKAEKRTFNRVVESQIQDIISIPKVEDCKMFDMEMLNGYDNILVEVFSDKPEYHKIVKNISKSDSVIFAFYLTPYKMNSYSQDVDINNNALICAYEDSEWAQRWVQRKCLGQTEFVGIMPVALDWI